MIGDHLLEPIDLLASVRPIVRHHHERWDGLGYPDGLVGEDIPLGARIMAVADAVEAMSARRVYRDPLSEPEIVRELERGRGTQWDPGLVDVVLRLIESDTILLVKGRVDLRGREMQLAAIEIKVPDLTDDGAPAPVRRSTDPVVVDLPAEICSAGMVSKLKETLAAYPGQTAVRVRMLSSKGVTTLRIGDGYRVDGSEGLLSELRRLLGRDHVRVEAGASATR